MYITDAVIDQIFGRVALKILDSVADAKGKGTELPELTGFLNGASAAISAFMDELKEAK